MEHVLQPGAGYMLRVYSLMRILAEAALRLGLTLGASTYGITLLLCLSLCVPQFAQLQSGTMLVPTLWKYYED